MTQKFAIVPVDGKRRILSGTTTNGLTVGPGLTTWVDEGCGKITNAQIETMAKALWNHQCFEHSWDYMDARGKSLIVARIIAAVKAIGLEVEEEINV